MFKIIESFLLLLFTHSFVSNSLRPHKLQHARLPCPSLSSRVCSNSCPLSWWCNHLILCCPLLIISSIFLSIRVFTIESALHIRSLECWSFSFSVSPSNEYLGLISFRNDWFDLLGVQETLRESLRESPKASILRCSAFFVIQLSHLYVTIGKTIALTIWTFVGKAMSLLLNMLSRFSSKE